MFPTPRAGQSMKICVLIKKGSGLTDARLWVRSCEYLQWTFHCRNASQTCVSNRFFNTSSLSPCNLLFSPSEWWIDHDHPEDFFPRQVISNVDFNYQGSLIAWGTGAGSVFWHFFLFHKISPKDMQMLHPSLMQCRWEKFWEESNIDGFQHCYPAWGTKTMLRLQGLCKISLLLHMVFSMNVVLCFDYLATGCVVWELPLEIHRLPFSNS